MRRNPSRILAIDPGTEYLGYADFEGKDLVDFGVRTIHQGGLAIILDHVEHIVDRMLSEKRPDLVAIEKSQFSQSTGNYRLMHVIGRMETVAKRHRVPMNEYHARTIRRVVTGNGNATKRETANMVVSRYPETRMYLKNRTGTQDIYFGNLFDAVACGMAHLAISKRQTPPRLSWWLRQRKDRP